MTGPAVAVVTNSRSPGVLAAAAVEAAGLHVVDTTVPARLDVDTMTTTSGPCELRSPPTTSTPCS